MPEVSSTNLLHQSLMQEIFFGILTLLFLALAYNRKYFRLSQPSTLISTSFKHVALVFFTYIGVSLVLTHLISFIVGLFVHNHHTEIRANVLYVGWINLFLQCISLLLICWFSSRLFPNLLSQILRARTGSSFKSAIGMGLVSYIIAIPAVNFMATTIDIFVYLLHGVEQIPDQQAVNYLKSAMMGPFTFLIAILSIIVLAPVLEELLFRGFLQNWLKRYLGRIGSITATAFIFASFHYSMSQGIGNLSIIGSLFILAFFLGFIYEREQNLLASITLHAAFNSISTLSLFLYQGI